MEEKKITKQEVIDLISDWVGCTDNEFCCSTEESEKIYHRLKQVEDFINNQEQQLQLKDKMIELMAESIMALSYKTKSIKSCRNSYQERARQALAELEK